MQRKKQTVLIPQKLLKWLEGLEKQPPDIKGYKHSRIEYIISTILTHKQDEHPGAYSLLNMGYLRNIVPNAHEYINYLGEKGEGIIEWVNYSAGRNSRMYRLKREYEGPAVYRTLTDQNLIRRIEEHISNRKLRNSKKYKKLNEYTRSVSIDLEAAIHTVEERYSFSVTQDREKAESRRTYSLGEISRLENGDIYYKVNDTNFRYDSNFTRLPSELVRHLTIDGNHLTEIDIANSQPFFAACLFDPTPEIEKVINDYLGKNYTMSIKELHLSEYEDVVLYRSLVQSGLYDYLMKRFEEEGIPFVDIKDLKEEMFAVFFGRNSVIRYSKATKLFSKLFPHIYQLFAFIKEPEHNRLPILLQRIESYVMIECVIQKIIFELPDVKFITKHDSVLPVCMMVANKTGEVEAIMSQVIQSITRMQPKLKIKEPQPYITTHPSTTNITISQ